MMKKILLINLIFLVTIFLNSCELLNEVQKTATLSKCDFRVASAQNITLAGVNVQNIKQFSDLTILDGAKLTNAVLKNQFPLDLTVNVEGKNPNASPAGMTALDWILFIDNQQMTQGTLNQAFTIPANNGTANIPMNMHFDLKQVLSGKSTDAIINFGLNLAGAGNKPSRITMKLKPTINVQGFPITYPGYITIGTDFTGLK